MSEGGAAVFVEFLDANKRFFVIVKTFFGGFFCLLFHINRYLDDSVIQ